MNKQIIIGLVGLLAAGKGTVAEYLKKEYQANIYGFSKPLRDILQRIYLPIDRANMDSLSTILRQQFSQNILSETITEDIKKDQNKIIVLDGIRRFTDIELAKKLPGFKLIGIMTDEEIRYQRLLKRRQNIDDQNKSLKEFQEDNKSEANIQIPEVMEKAEINLDNNGTPEELYKKIDNLITELTN